jgi:DNA-binding NarL/FixJ family response regulator
LVGLVTGGVAISLQEVETVRALVPLSGDPLVRLAALNQIAWTLGSAARYDEAVAAGDHLAAEAEASGIEFAVNHGLLARAASLVGLRQFAAAQQALLQVRQRLRHEPDRWAATNLAIQQARLQISLGDLERAADCLALDPEQPIRASNEAEYNAYRALIDAARGREEAATKRLEGSLGTSRNLEACAIAWIGQAVLAVTAVVNEIDAQRIFEATRQAGHHDAIVIGCRAQPELATRIACNEENGKALRAILLRSNDELLARAAGLAVPRTTRRGEMLSQRENEVYELMILGRTNREIARRLFITESTTKVHVRHILEKLGVRSRVEAVRAWRPTAASDSGLDDAG